ncbi:helix-turn-helix domain-containing protein [Chloroflexota bacterium]
MTFNKEGNFIKHLRAERNLSIDAFAKKLGITTNELEKIEAGIIGVGCQ